PDPDARSDGAGPESHSGRHFAFPGTKLCQSERYSVPKPRRETGIWLDYELGYDHANGGNRRHDAQRSRRSGFAAANRVETHCDFADYPEGRYTSESFGST